GPAPAPRRRPGTPPPGWGAGLQTLRPRGAAVPPVAVRTATASAQRYPASAVSGCGWTRTRATSPRRSAGTVIGGRPRPHCFGVMDSPHRCRPRRTRPGEQGRRPCTPPGRGVSRGWGSSGRRRRKKGQGGAPGRGRRLTGRGFKQGATGKEGPGRAPHPGAAPHGAEVQAGGDGRGGAGRRGVPLPGLRSRSGVRCDLYVGFSEGWVKAARPAHLGGGPDDVYPRVVTLGRGLLLSPVTQSGQVGPCPGVKAAFRPSAASSRLPVLFGRPGSLTAVPVKPIQASGGPIRPGMRGPTSRRCRRGVQGAPPRLHYPCSSRSTGSGGLLLAALRRPGYADVAPSGPLLLVPATPPRMLTAPTPFPPSPPA